MKKRFSIKAGEHLLAGDYLVSANRTFFAILQEDGNICVCRGSSPVLNYGLLWSTRLKTSMGSYYLAMQSDGNLCVYKGSPGAASQWIWGAQDKALPLGDYYLILQDNGDLCVYLQEKGGPKKLIWHSGVTNTLKSFRILNIDYTIEKLVYNGTSTIELYHQEMMGPRDWNPYNGPGGYVNTGSWEDELQLKEREVSDYMTSVPIFENKKVVRGPANHRFVWNGESSANITFDMVAQLPLNVEDQHILDASHKCDIMHYTVPYTLRGESVLEIPQSKKGDEIIAKHYVTIPFETNGIYRGNWLWDRMEAHINLLDTVNNRTNKFRLAMTCTRFF